VERATLCGDRATPECEHICNSSHWPKFVCGLVHKGGVPSRQKQTSNCDPRCPLQSRERTSSGCLGMSEKCHVWTAPAVQEESDISAKRSGAAMYPAFDAAAMAAGPDVIR
jgi:hypothetical protein